MSRKIWYSRLMHKAAVMKCNKELKHINKPDPVVQTLWEVMTKKVQALVKSGA